jgi:hypothetical protein
VSQAAALRHERLPSRSVLELRVDEMRQMFNAMDPAPFRKRDLDPRAEAYIMDWAREAPKGVPLGIVVQLAGEPATPERRAVLSDAVEAYFRDRAAATRLALRRLFRNGRLSLVIGLAFLALAITAGELLAGLVDKESYASIVKESFVIGGWVALWRPIEIFLFDWWPLLADARLCDRLSRMHVEVVDAAPGSAA